VCCAKVHAAEKVRREKARAAEKAKRAEAASALQQQISQVRLAAERTHCISAKATCKVIARRQNETNTWFSRVNWSKILISGMTAQRHLFWDLAGVVHQTLYEQWEPSGKDG
jgi:3-phenylpropionate/cinnamic acid dioxygenase small subunit